MDKSNQNDNDENLIKPGQPTEPAKSHTTSSSTDNKSPDKIPPHHRLKWIFFKPDHVSRKKWLIIDGIILLLVLIATVSGVLIYKHLTKVKPVTNVAPTTRGPRTEASRLTGVQVDPALNSRPVTGVIIENSPDARPQAGIIDAGVVFEAIAEGGITRFLALYQEAQPKYIGPVRSVRPYYLDFALAFNASLAHVGGSPQALAQVKQLQVRDLDQFFNPGAYQRVSNRYAPHNVYTSMSQLDGLNRAKGFKSSDFDGFARKKDSPSKAPTAKSINMTLSGFYYNTAYSYSSKTNTYKRNEGGRPHTDERSRKQLSPKVLIAMISDYSIESDGIHSVYRTTGTGQALIFQDGVVIRAKWSKPKRSAQLQFKLSDGKPVKLNAGQTWITLLSKGSDVNYKK